MSCFIVDIQGSDPEKRHESRVLDVNRIVHSVMRSESYTGKIQPSGSRDTEIVKISRRMMSKTFDW